jgi:malyl-CoA/(S)-citramalyl-CoA lyase
MAIKDRLHRRELAVPGTNARAMEKAPALGADVVFLDLEDAVAPGDKEQARENAIEALLGLDWSGCAVSVRINGLDEGSDGSALPRTSLNGLTRERRPAGRGAANR